MKHVLLFPLFLSLLFIAACDDSDEGNKCGNGVLDPGEQCDPMMDTFVDGHCSEMCTLTQYCGNGLVEGTEECDDGNTGNEDNCSSNCEILRGCGNGLLDFTIDPETGRAIVEECDDDNLTDGDGCSVECRLESGTTPTCGNGRLEFPESCDDGNTTDGDGCSATCTKEYGCGDGSLNTALEECEDGNTINGDGCSARCRLEYNCGDARCDEEMGEVCDLCPQDCCSHCGNGVLDNGEECDDGNTVHFDGCSAGCFDEDGTPTCGNAILEVSEECDDGNLEINDGCNDVCEREFDVGDNTCDVDHGENCRLSPADCCPQCNNGIHTIDPGEQCDGNNLGGVTCQDLCFDGGELACYSWCEFDTSGCTGTGPICGDGTAECLEECDTTDLRGRTCQNFGYSEGTLACSAGCEYDVSGCSGFSHYVSENFDTATLPPTDWVVTGTVWDMGTPTDGPPTVPSGANLLGTNLTGHYRNSMTFDSNNVRMPEINLTLATVPMLTFQSWMYAESCCDGGVVQVSVDQGQTWTNISNSLVSPHYNNSTNTRWTGQQQTWTLYTVDLTSYVGQIIQLRFAFRSDSSINQSGWFIDDVLVSEVF